MAAFSHLAHSNARKNAVLHQPDRCHCAATCKTSISVCTGKVLHDNDGDNLLVGVGLPRLFVSPLLHQSCFVTVTVAGPHACAAHARGNTWQASAPHFLCVIPALHALALRRMQLCPRAAVCNTRAHTCAGTAQAAARVCTHCSCQLSRCAEQRLWCGCRRQGWSGGSSGSWRGPTPWHALYLAWAQSACTLTNMHIAASRHYDQRYKSSISARGSMACSN